MTTSSDRALFDTNILVHAMPLSAPEALADIEKLATVFPMILPPDSIHERVFALLRQVGFSGRQVFDLHLAATMLGNGVSRIYTYDLRFAKIPEITALTP